MSIIQHMYEHMDKSKVAKKPELKKYPQVFFQTIELDGGRVIDSSVSFQRGVTVPLLRSRHPEGVLVNGTIKAVLREGSRGGKGIVAEWGFWG